MRTWNDYKEHVRTVDPEISKDMEEVEALSQIVKAMVEQRNALGLSQRELAALCGIPQSSVARIEAMALERAMKRARDSSSTIRST